MTDREQAFDQWFAERYPDTTSVYSEFKATPVRDLMREAMAAGREQGLREAGTACETQSLNKMHADLKSIARKHWRAFHETSHAKWQGMAMAYEQAAIKCKRAAAAIEQLRRPRAT